MNRRQRKREKKKKQVLNIITVGKNIKYKALAYI